MKKILWISGVVFAIACMSGGQQAMAQTEEAVEEDAVETVEAADDYISASDQVSAMNTGVHYGPARQCSNPVEFGGYFNAGYYGNTRGADYNGPTNCNSESGGAFNGAYIFAKKDAYTGGCGSDFGFGVDFMFGQDSRFMRSYTGFDEDWYTGHNRRGEETYGFAMPQLYGELAVNDWSVKAGHFYTLLRYESAKASDRFFYSLGYGFQALPVTHTGVLASYNGFENLDITFGWVNGVNSGFENDFDERMMTGKFTYRPTSCMSVSYAFVVGDMNPNQETGVVGVSSLIGGLFNNQMYDEAKGGIQSIVIEYKPTCKTTLVTSIDYADYSISGVNSRNNDYKFNLYGTTLGQHIYYDYNECWKFGTRIEWWKGTTTGEREGRRGMQKFYNSDAEVASWTIGANWTPFCCDQLVIRPELRYDKLAGEHYSGFGKRGDKDDQVTIGFDVMYKF